MTAEVNKHPVSRPQYALPALCFLRGTKQASQVSKATTVGILDLSMQWTNNSLNQS